MIASAYKPYFLMPAGQSQTLRYNLTLRLTKSNTLSATVSHLKNNVLDVVLYLALLKGSN
jgi:hypothetical protein